MSFRDIVRDVRDSIGSLSMRNFDFKLYPSNSRGKSQGSVHELQMTGSILKYMSISPQPATFIQTTVSDIMVKTEKEFFHKIILTLRESADICYDFIQEIDCIICPYNREGSMFVMIGGW
ncbi:hypothetical protein ZOSMA_103G00030 [Zostera marina]|uniref:Uncharacterized protein n=1 Tax=Zostera marina TaxID=29655 RepID=A0A0K9Q541_ZOSMR|nr:hypothetical protein ZOSMA_103G00030 [Zostera marina]